MRRRTAALLTALGLTAGGAGVSYYEGKGPVDLAIELFGDDQEMKGQIAPDFDLPLLDGRQFRLYEALEKGPVVVNFWATWCRPCVEEMPVFQRLHEEGVQVVAVNYRQKPEAANEFARQNGYTFPIALDNGHISAKYGVGGYPTTFVVGNSGLIGFSAEKEVSYRELKKEIN